MSKVKSESVPGTKMYPEGDTKKTAEPKISIDSFVSLRCLGWNVKARLEHYMQVEKLYDDMTIKQWDNILKKI